MAEEAQNPEEVDGVEPEEQDVEASQPKYTDDDVDAIVAKRLAREQKKAEKTIADAKKAAEREKMTADELLKSIQAENDELKRQTALTKATTSVRSMLAEANLPDFMAEALANTDEAVQSEHVELFTAGMKAYRESIVNEVMKGRTPAAPKTNDGTTTQEQFNKMKLAERTELFQTNPELYRQLSK